MPPAWPAGDAEPISNGSSAHVLLPFWFATTAIAAGWIAGVDLSSSTVITLALAVMLVGGMPHGAFDILLLARSGLVEGRGLTIAVAGYVTIAVTTAALWALAPAVALLVFLAAAVMHFSEDWAVLDDALFRVAAGASVVAAPALGQFSTVAALFDTLAGGAAGNIIARVAVTFAPVAILVALVGLVTASQWGSRRWATSMTVALIMLVLTPPIVGFALFFVFLHSPRHLMVTRQLLRDVPQGRWIATGAALTTLAIGGGLAFLAAMGVGAASIDSAQAFRLLAVVAMPHLLLSHELARAPVRFSGQGQNSPI